ncbi:MAG: site-specific recombinase [Pseudomonadota bacterium]
MSAASWDLTALLNAADPRAPLPERHLWLARLMQWLRHGDAAADGATPRPVLRLRQLLQVLDQHPQYRAAVQGLLQAFWREIDIAALFAEFGFSPRLALAGALGQRLHARLLPGTPATHDLAALFPLLFDDSDSAWLAALDASTLARTAELLCPEGGTARWRDGLLEAMAHLVSAVRAAAFTAPMRLRMDRSLLANDPFGQLARTAEDLADALRDGDGPASARHALYLRALLDACRQATASIASHLEEHGVSVDIVFEADQLQARTLRIEMLLDTLLEPTPAEGLRLMISLVEVQAGSRSIRALLGRHYSLLARRVAERNAETGEHYITRTRAEYRDMLGRAAGGGVVIAGTTMFKFALATLGLTAFWSGFWAGTNYALSFVLIMLLHWTVATKQPAMTAPALAARLHADHDAAGGEEGGRIETFVDEVTHLIRSQVAGIVGNVALCAPVVLALQWLGALSFGAPPIGHADAVHVLHSLTLLGPTALFAAFTGVLLFASSLIAGWAENWFVLHRLDSAIAWNPRIVARLGSARAQRWSRWWRANISALAANISLGMLLGLVPVVFDFFGIGLEVRHVTLSTGQLAAALGAEGASLLHEPAFWWCVAGIAVIGALNLGVSFWLAFTVALRSRGIAVRERALLYSAIRRRLWHAPLSFFWPPRDKAVPARSAA